MPQGRIGRKRSSRKPILLQKELMAKDAWSLEGETALVTGATKGIGRAVAEELARQGVHVWVCARNGEDLDQCLAEWRNATWEGSIHGCVCDVSVPESRDRLIDLVAKHFSGTLSILVNNVAIVEEGSTPSENVLKFQNTMETNVGAALHLSELAYPLMKANGKGSIIFNSSIGGLYSLGLEGGTKLYSASKGALNQLAKDLAVEWAKDNMRVNAICPGYTETDLLKNTFSSETIERVIGCIPLRRLADPIEIAYSIVFLCMPAASYITGTIMTVDGGRTSHISPFSSTV